MPHDTIVQRMEEIIKIANVCDTTLSTITQFTFFYLPNLPNSNQLYD
jgi:hypothetical protein